MTPPTSGRAAKVASRVASVEPGPESAIRLESIRITVLIPVAVALGGAAPMSAIPKQSEPVWVAWTENRLLTSNASP